MQRIVKYLLKPIIVVLCCAGPVLGQVNFIATADRQKIGMDGTIQIEYTIENAADVQQFTPPTYKNFVVVDGPTYVSSTILLNGKITPSKSFIYILQPKSIGTFVLLPATAKVNGKTISSNTLTIEILSAPSAHNKYQFRGTSSSDQMNLYSDYILKRGEDLQDKIRKNLFIKVDVDKTSCFEGESVVATYKLYTRLKSESKIVKRPSFNGFSVFDMVNPESETPSAERWNGKEYNVYLIRKAQLFPLQSGSLELDPAEVENKISFLKAEFALQRSAESLSNLIQSFVEDDAGKDGIQVEHVSISSNPLMVKVKPLPELNKPVGYDGAVGKFDISAKLDKSKVAMNDIATLAVTVKGAGNFGVINAPTITWPHSFETYEPTVKENFFRTVSPMQGSKIFQFTFMPKQLGEFGIPPIVISYFDPQSNKYRTVQTDSASISVVAAASQKSNSQYKIMALEGQDKLDLKINRIWVLSTSAIMLIALGIILYWQLKRKPEITARKQPEVVEEARSAEEIPTISISPLFEARLYLVQQNNRSFYSELRKSLWEFLDDKFKLPESRINREDLAQIFRQNGLDELTLEQFHLVIHQCDIALYTPDNKFNDMQSAYDLAEEFIENVNSRLKNPYS